MAIELTEEEKQQIKAIAETIGYPLPVKKQKVKRKRNIHPHFNSPTKDHIIPKAFLKKLNRSNIKIMTRAENVAKGDKLTKEGLEKIFKTILEHL